MAFRWAEVYNIVNNAYGSSTSDFNGYACSGNVNGTSFSRILKHNSGSYTFSHSNTTNGDDHGETKHYLPSCMPSTTLSATISRGRTVVDIWWFFGGWEYGAQNDLNTVRIKKNGTIINDSDGTKYTTVKAGDYITGYINVVGYAYDGSGRKDRYRTNSSYSWSATTNVSSNALYYFTGSLNTFPSSGICTTNPNITGRAIVSLPMSEGSSWTNGVTQWYKTGAHSLKAISNGMTASSHVVKGSYVALTDIDTTVTTTISNLTSLTISSSNTLQASNGSTSLIFTSGSLSVNGSSRNPYIRDLKVRVGYW